MKILLTLLQNITLINLVKIHISAIITSARYVNISPVIQVTLDELPVFQ